MNFTTPRWWSPSRNGSDFLWHGVDETVVDGAVNGSASTVVWLSDHLRKLETGFVQTYALAILVGVVAHRGLSHRTLT